MTKSSVGSSRQASANEKSEGSRRARPGSTASVRTPNRILDAALVSFAGRGYDATSLDALAVELDVAKQTILYWFPSKEVLLASVTDRSAQELSTALELSLSSAGEGWARVEAVVRSVFRLAAKRPELLGLVREMGRLGPPAATRFVDAMEPLVQRASSFLQAEMDAGQMRKHDPRLLLLAIYSTVIGMVAEVEVLKAFGEEPTTRSLVRRRGEILQLLRCALLPDTAVLPGLPLAVGSSGPGT